MTKLFNQLIVATAAVFIVACNSASTDSETSETMETKETTSFDLSSAKSSIEAENAKFMEAFKKGDSAAAASNYSHDAMMLPPNSEPVGKAGIASLWGSFMGM